MGKLKTYIKTKITDNKKKNSSEENQQQKYRHLLHSKKEEIRKSKRLCEIELTNSIKESKTFKYFSNNKKGIKRNFTGGRTWFTSKKI